MGGLWHYIYELFINILRVFGVIAFEFFSCRIVSVAYVDVPCVVAITEEVELYSGCDCGCGYA